MTKQELIKASSQESRCPLLRESTLCFQVKGGASPGHWHSTLLYHAPWVACVVCCLSGICAIQQLSKGLVQKHVLGYHAALLGLHGGIS